MTILSFKFEDKSLNWKLEEFSLSKLTLLVGASGVGKTRILKSLMALKQISKGEFINGIAWKIEFQTLGNKKYIWEGEYENKESDIFIDVDDEKDSPQIKFERLLLDDELIIDRKADQILLMNKPIIKLAQEKSIIHLLKEEEKIKPAYEGMRKLDFIDYSYSVMVNRLAGIRDENIIEEYNTLEKIRESNLPTVIKLYILQKIDLKTFNIIIQRFTEIFPQVEDIKVSTAVEKGHRIYDSIKDILLVHIKEKGVEEWIKQTRISSGMFRTLMQLSELYLCAEGTVFLIDEFENSLGINCINEVTRDILSSDRKLQFILTSHHPYIIDTIGYNYWKLVTRNAGIVKTHNMDKFNIGKSKHSAFMQLIQLEEYQTGEEQ